MSRARAVLGAAILATFPVSRARAEQATVVVQWNRLLDDAIAESLLGPPMAARAFAITHTCIFDAWAAYDRAAVGTRLGGSLRRPEEERTKANRVKAISYAAYRALVDLFPDQRATRFDPKMAALGFDPDDLSTDPSTPAGIGNVACAAVLEFRHQDGSNQLNGYADDTGYTPVNPPSTIPVSRSTVADPDRWQPLIYDENGATVTQTFLGAQWGQVVPFALRSGDQFRALVGIFGPAKYGSTRYVQQSQELLDLSAGLDDRSKMIAEYWANGPNDIGAVMHWGYFAEHVSLRDGHSLGQDVKMFFTLANAELDASIAAWDAKRAFDSVRPVTSIPYLFTGEPVLAWAGPGRGTQLIDGGTWVPYLGPPFHVTPPFPEYVSGHSTFGAAGAEILKRFTGSDDLRTSVTLPAGSSHIEPGITPRKDVVLKWATFTDAANQNGLSRRFGGVHFKAGDLVGREVGRLVAAQAWKKARTYIDGSARSP